MKYDFSINTTTNNTHTLILQRISPGSTVLEFGPATGYMTKYMKEELSCTVYCVEIDEEAAQKAQPFSEKMIVADVDSMVWVEELQDIKFEHIVFADVLEHLRDPWKVLEVATNFLKQNGTVLTSIPNVSHSAVIMGLLQNDFTYRNLGLLDNTHIRFFTRKTVVDLFSRANLFPVEWLSTYMTPDQTELEQSYGSMPESLKNYLEHKEDSHVYQFITVSKRVEDISPYDQAVLLDKHSYIYRDYFQVFWETKGRFTEDCSFRLPLQLNNGFAKYEIVIPAAERLRIDPGTKSGIYIIKSIELVSNNENGNLSVYKWDEVNEFAGVLPGANVKQVKGKNYLTLIGINDDPSIFIDNPLRTASLFSEMTLRIEMSFTNQVSHIIDEYENLFQGGLFQLGKELTLVQSGLERTLINKNKIIDFENKLQIQSEEINTLKDEINNVLLILDDNNNQKEGLLNEIVDCKNEITQLQNSLSEQHSHFQISLSQQQILLEHEKQLVKNKDGELFHLNQQLTSILNSTSWKVTSPFRKIGQFLRRVKRKIKSYKANYEIIKNKKNEISNIKKKIASGNKKVLLFSHTDYLNSMGGTEKYIYEQTLDLRSKGIESLQIFPAKLYGFLEEVDSYYGINLNQEFQGFFHAEQIGDLIENCSTYFDSLFIHHLLYWQYRDFSIIRQKFDGIKIKKYFFMHDFFACCSSYHMMYKDDTIQKPCIPEMYVGDKEAVCASCNHNKNLKEWREKLSTILRAVDHIIVPSKYVLSGINIIYPEFNDKVKVWGHLVLQSQETTLPKSKHKKIRMAYLGYKMINKGWETWERVYKDKKLNEIYDFYHIGSNENYADNVQSSNYSFIDNGVMGAVDCIKQKEIDLVILWSIVPESYSYTMYEAIAAGVPIITNTWSGNIADTVKSSSDLGMVFQNEREMIDFISFPEQVEKLIQKYRNQYRLTFNPLQLNK